MNVKWFASAIVSLEYRKWNNFFLKHQVHDDETSHVWAGANIGGKAYILEVFPHGTGKLVQISAENIETVQAIIRHNLDGGIWTFQRRQQDSLGMWTAA